MKRRHVVAGLALAAAGGAALWRLLRAANDDVREEDSGVPLHAPVVQKVVGGMPYRSFGRSTLLVSEVGFGAWAIGGKAYGTVNRQESLRALARAEEHGCNLVDTAMVYGDSEVVLGEFLQGRRSKWLIATKFSGQPGGMTATLETQLQRLRTDAVDFYQLHWPPGRNEQSWYEELYRLKKAGKARLIGVSVYSATSIDKVLSHPQIDGVQVPFSLLSPEPFLARARRLRESGCAVLVRSSLEEGFLAGKFRRDATFPDPNDQRHGWSRAQIERTVDRVERFRFLEPDSGSMISAAVRYPLSFPEVSSVLLGAKNATQADFDFGQVPGGRLTTQRLVQIRALQRELGLRSRRAAFGAVLRRITGLDISL